MAHLVMNNGDKKTVPREVGESLWKGLQNPETLDKDQLKYLERVKGIYLNWRFASDEYVSDNLQWIVPMTLNEWLVDRNGRFVRPGSDHAWRFAKKWGLWSMGAPTHLINTRPV